MLHKSTSTHGRLRVISPSLAVITRIDAQITVQLRKGRRCFTLTRPLGQNNELVMAKMLFTLLRRATGYTPPWGLLTGMRPSKLMLRLRRDEGAIAAQQHFRNEFWVSDEKTQLASTIAKAEEPIIALTRPRSFSLYISIPFCPSRCSYCSFVSQSIDRASAQKLIPSYIDALCKEIAFTGEIARNLGLKLASVYIGGGTPTSLTSQQLYRLCETLHANFNITGEFTVEAGRVDTITSEKLRVLREHGVNRISVNPQSMHDYVLQLAGRQHSAQDVLEAYDLVRAHDFACVNMDLIAGLPGDKPEGFTQSLEQVIALKPENITVHVIAIKRAAQLEQLPTSDFLYNMPPEYAPYYMYRQSRSLGNLENIGWTLPGHGCRYNVDMMEESHTILACGAGAVTKLKHPNSDDLERVFGLKYPYEYLRRFDELMQRKARVTEFYGALLKEES
ncbi:MAG: coproporphyrinogen dehydrogenase HemZ [Oscillospiraceae bacterium]|nr:coproporphyrinogen dehydrogenase HemZ [Oscillospiraceae bacterium]